jgi:RNA polymerase sigma-70 factor (ECF subfamily)
MTQEIIDLIEQAKKGSQKAFSELYYRYKSNIWYTILNVVKNTDVADDLTSIVFTKAYEKLSTYVNHISFEMWLKTIAVNASIDYIRRNKKEQLNNYVDEDENPIQLSALERSPEEDLILKEKLDIVLQAIPTLKKKYRDLINARIDGMSYKEIASKLAMNELAVKGNLNKARQKLKQKTDY